MHTEKTTDEHLRMLKHDIKNQLSHITMALEQLRYEMPEINADSAFYFDTISNSAKQINTMVDSM